MKIVSVLLEPGARAYSWYFHQRAHNIPAAMKYSFMEVLNAKDGDDSQLLDLQNVREKISWVCGLILVVKIFN